MLAGFGGAIKQLGMGCAFKRRKTCPTCKFCT
ncbi:hypothetical protein ACI7YW_09200 [Clostridium ljungdahlii]